MRSYTRSRQRLAHACFPVEAADELFGELYRRLEQLRLTCQGDQVCATLSRPVSGKRIAKDGALDEQTQRYRAIRSVLKQIVTDMRSGFERTKPGSLLQAAHTYLHGHCAECGATLEQHDYALVHAQEMLRIGTSETSDVVDMPICPACYALRCVVRQQFAPADLPEQD